MDTCLHCPKTPPGSPMSLSPPESSDSEVSEGVSVRERERIFGQLSKAVRVVFLTEGKKETSANTCVRVRYGLIIHGLDTES